MSGFKKAQRKQSKFKGSIQGASGSGKTFTALKIATELVKLTDPGKRIAVIDTERSAELYSPPFDFDVDGDFGEGLKVSYNPDKLVEKLENARKSGEYGAVIIDSATHFWKEQGGFTKMIDTICEAQRARGGKGDSFAAWKQVDPLYRKLMTYIRNYPMHVILCVRAKQAYERGEEKGKGSLKKVGMEPEFREGFEFEMDAQFAIDQDHVMVPLKHRLSEFLDGKTFRNPGEDVATLIHEWITQGAPGQEEPAPVAVPVPPPSFTAAKVDETRAMVHAAAEEAGPDTTKMPETEPKIPVAAHVVSEPASATEAFVAEIALADSIPALKEIANRVKTAHRDKLVSAEEYAQVISPAYQARSKALRVAA